MPKTINIPGDISDTLSVVSAPGEYEPASFVLQTEENIKGLRLEVTDLETNGDKVISRSNIDIKVVKCWYQDEGEGYQKRTPVVEIYSPLGFCGEKVLVPELLLHDDSLIKVDTERKQNYLKKSKGEYVIISSERKGEGVSGFSAIPVKDSPSLLPVDIREKTNKQFWITVYVAEDAVAGRYEGQIKLISKEKLIGTLFLKLKVLPFKLSKPYYISSIYYRSPDKQFYKAKFGEQFRKELKDLFIHGVTDVMCPSSELLKEFLECRKAMGVDGRTLFYCGENPGNPTAPKELERVKSKVKETIEFVKPYGIKEVYFYGIDEAKGERLKSQTPVWEAVHKAGGKIFVAGYSTKGIPPGNFALVGDIQDLLVCAWYPSREEAAKWHSKGHKILCYANPQGGAEQPQTYRGNYGLLLWQYDYDGAMTWCYHTNWGDFCRQDSYKQFNMVYPTIDGVINTLQWEGYREGVDDIKYLTTLFKAIEKANKSKSRKIQKAISEAETYLKQLKDSDINKTRRDLDTTRLEIVNYILKLKEK